MVWINKFQGEAFLFLIIVQVLGLCVRFHITQKIVVVLNENIHPVVLLHTVDKAIFPDGLRNDLQAGFLSNFSHQCLFHVLPCFNAATGEFIVVVFQAVHHSDFSIPNDNSPDGRTHKRLAVRVIVLCIDFK